MPRIGVGFPHGETTADPGPIREFVHAAERLGFSSLNLNDHVLGAAPQGRTPAWRGPYTHEDLFHEVMVTLAYVAALTDRLVLSSYVLVLPQRQTALVAKQAAEVALLSGGRLRLGVGTGWNDVEFEALGEEFAGRGARLDAQIAVLRDLWANDIVVVADDHHGIDHAGIRPRPGHIPIWIGGSSLLAARRAGRLGDGWMPHLATPADPHSEFFFAEDGVHGAGLLERLEPHREAMSAAARSAGRDPEAIPICLEVPHALLETGEATQILADYAALGIAEVTVSTAHAGLAWPEGHIAALEAWADAYSIRAPS